jgi:hypothetical protein
MARLLRVLAVLAGPVLACNACAGPGGVDDDAPWMEGEVVIPAFPQDADLLEFYVSAATANRFFIDARSLAVGADGVVRYALVVRTSGGATNVTFEGIRCAAREYKTYATGRSDRTWVASRVAEWRPIENKPMNRHHAALSRDYFCPGGVAIFKADEGRDALRRGKHPQAE